MPEPRGSWQTREEPGKLLGRFYCVGIQASLHVLTPGAHVGRSGESLVVHQPDDAPEVKRPIRELESILLHGNAQVSTQALDLCSRHNVAVHWLTTSGWHVASLTSTAGRVQRRLRQYRALA